jgi:hypothetical protein
MRLLPATLMRRPSRTDFLRAARVAGPRNRRLAYTKALDGKRRARLIEAFFALRGLSWHIFVPCIRGGENVEIHLKAALPLHRQSRSLVMLPLAVANNRTKLPPIQS